MLLSVQLARVCCSIRCWAVDAAADQANKASQIDNYKRRSARSASSRLLVCLAIPTFDRIAVLGNRHLIILLGISLTWTVSSLGWRLRLGNIKTSGQEAHKFLFLGGHTLTGWLPGVWAVGSTDSKQCGNLVLVISALSSTYFYPGYLDLPPKCPLLFP